MIQAKPHNDRGSAPAAHAPCWSCQAPADGLFCAGCGAVQPPGGADHFRRLGLKRRFALDVAELDRRYFALQRQLHPDRFVKRSARERAVSQSQAASLNQAYETLRDPLSRAAYLLELEGVEVAAADGRTISDPALLMEAMEMREALAEAEDPGQVEALAKRNEAERAEALARLDRHFAEQDRDAARAETLRLKYLAKFAEDLRARRAALRAAAAEPRP